MTFDEAVREYELRSSIGPLVQGIKISPFVNVPQQEYDRVKFMNRLFYSIIEQLREEYAPTVEMTELQREYWEKANENNFKALDKKTTSGLFVGDMPDKKTTLTITVRQSINAVLRPETIKVVDE
ncbi:hypothetical protein [Leuconostoc pseudomesenteroides]|uniref:hypothetical protein n=1 Tax=Leuconostoc pseudomesenteroides TaxID=33968 RepID=UPI0039E7C3A2